MGLRRDGTWESGADRNELGGKEDAPGEARR